MSIMVGIYSFRGERGTQWNLMFALIYGYPVRCGRMMLLADWMGQDLLGNARSVDDERRFVLSQALARADRQKALSWIDQEAMRAASREGASIGSMLRFLVDAAGIIEAANAQRRACTSFEETLVAVRKLNWHADTFLNPDRYCKAAATFLGGRLDGAIERGLKDSRRVIYRIREEVDKKYAEPLSVRQFADRYYLREEYISKLFKQEFQINFVAYLTGMRMKKAMELILNTDIQLTDIPAIVGYVNPEYFFRVFKKTYGHPPSYYR